MTPLEFCYWLKGYFELGEFVRPKEGDTTLSVPFTPVQVLQMRNHLHRVFETLAKEKQKDTE
jgi:hypothetical protein